MAWASGTRLNGGWAVLLALLAAGVAGRNSAGRAVARRLGVRPAGAGGAMASDATAGFPAGRGEGSARPRRRPGAHPGRLRPLADALRAERRPDRRRSEVRGAGAGLHPVPDRRRGGVGPASQPARFGPGRSTPPAAAFRSGGNDPRRHAHPPRRGDSHPAGRRDPQPRTATGRVGETARHQQLLPRQRPGEMAHTRPALSAGALPERLSRHRLGVLRQSPASGT